MITAYTIAPAYHRLGAGRMDLIAPEAKIGGGRLIVAICNDTFRLTDRRHLAPFLRLVIFIGQPNHRRALDLKRIPKHLVSGVDQGVMRARGHDQAQGQGNPLTWPAAAS